MDLKATLKAIKLNEPTISTVLGALVVLAVGILVINYFRSKPQTTGSVTPSTQTEQAQPKPGGKHTVDKGEHLWGIAQKYYQSGYNWVDIAQANSLANPNLLVEGTELTIPDIPAKQNTLEASPQMTNAPPSGEPIQGDNYTVVKGDNLWEISVRAYGDGFQWPKIWETNKNQIPTPNLIYPDQKITLPR